MTYWKETKHRIFVNLCETAKMKELKLDADCEFATRKTVHIFSEQAGDLVNISFIKSPHIIFNVRQNVRHIIASGQIEIRFQNSTICPELRECIEQNGKLLREDWHTRSWTYQLPEYDYRYLIIGELLPNPFMRKSARNV
jgi:hypothetical protein